jgi:hypothetical protein
MFLIVLAVFDTLVWEILQSRSSLDLPEKILRRIQTWKLTTFFSHIVSRSLDDRFPVPSWELETWFCS